MNGEAAVSGLASGDWMELARRGIRLARQAVAELGREGEIAVAFSLHGDVADERGLEGSVCSARVFEEEPPDLVLLETMSLVREVDLRGGRGPDRHAASRSGSASGAAATGSAASSASTGAAPRATSSAGRRGASRRWASARC